MSAASGLRLERMRSSKQFSAGRFRNTARVTPGLKHSALPIMADFVFGGAKRAPRGQVPLEIPLATWSRPVQSGLRVTWLGHSTLLLEMDGLRVLTDPVFGPRASPVSFAGARRFHPAPVTVEQLPPLDAVLLSHDHYDHLCRATMTQLARRRVPVITSLGVGAHLERMGVEPACIIELDWWETHELGALSFTATPSQHFSGRGVTDRNETLWSSWVLQSDRRRVFFSGDTGLTPEFEDVGARFGPFDLTLLEVGAYHPAWGDIHLGPENALTAFDMLGGGTLLPVHWGTFDLALHTYEEPVETLLSRAAERGTRVLTPPIGRPFEPEHVEGPTPWWRQLVVDASVAARVVPST